MSSKKINLIKKNLSDIIHKYFNSDLYTLTKDKVKNVYNDPKINVDFKNITKTEYKDILGIITFIKKNPDKKLGLREKPELPSIEEIIKENTDDKKPLIKYKDFKGEKYVSFQRKAFINFINDDFYKIVKNETDKNDFKIYQNFVKYYLSLETPYRGLLVYHGLGTGKTATAITTAESLSENMEIFTLLPASLETNFIDEVKRWRSDIFDLDDNNWVFMTEHEVLENTEFRRMLFEKYHISIDDLNSIYLKAKRNSKDKIEVGYWKISEDIKNDKNKIKTVNGKIKGNKGDSEIDAILLTTGEKLQIQLQIDLTIKYRYNFIHYNPFPSVKDSNIKEFLDENNEDILQEIDEGEEAKTINQKLVKRLESKLKENRKKYLIDSPFYNETIIIDEVHNFVRQISNKTKSLARVFYEWIINAKNIKLICLSGTPIINKPSEIAILFNMIRGLTKTFNFSIESPDNMDTNDIFQKCKDIFYKNDSPIDQIYVFQRNGKIIISFMQNTTRFESIMNPDNRIVYTVQYKNHNFEDFMEYIYNGLHQLYDSDKIIPSKNTYDKLTENQKNDIIKGEIIKFDVDGNILTKNQEKYKSESNIRFNIYRKLFSVDTDEDTIDLSDNDKFMEYFFENGDDILNRKRTLLKRMLLGLTSYYPIDRSSIVNMPEIILPQNNPERYIEYKIASSINVETCMMSNMQFEKYYNSYLRDKERNMKYSNKNMYDGENFDYHINTRRMCNMIYANDNFRYINKDDKNYLIEKNKEYDELYQNGSLRINNGLQYYSPKFNRMMNNIQKFSGETSKGKILFYSEFRSDSGAEIFEKILQANNYKKLGDDIDTVAYRYTFITGSESVEERRKNLDLFNDRKNNHGEYVQIMVISGAGAEGISLNCVRQVHILEPYWNYVRIDQVLGRAIRMLSHIGNDKNNPLLPPNQRNVEQYI